MVDPVDLGLNLNGIGRLVQAVHGDAVRTAAVISRMYPEAAKHIMDNVYRGVTLP